MSSILVLDTETIGIDKPFCYNIGWIVYELDTDTPLAERDFVVEQIWHNLPLFSTSYYAEKRQLYVASMRAHKTIMDKWGYIMCKLANDIRKNEVQAVFAYNSTFDDRVITFNCDWFRTNNPLDTVPVIDIRGMVSQYISDTKEYKDFCEQHELFTDAGHYSTTAEAVYKFVTDNPDFTEDHMALADAKIETGILLDCASRGANPFIEYKVKNSIPRWTEKPLQISIDGEIIYKGTYRKKTIRNNAFYFYTDF
jgi:hypothetical protein